MSTATQDWIEGDLNRLEQQKQRYELALRSAPTAAARERHLRNVARLDEEIAGRREALQAVTPMPGRIEAPVVDVSEPAMGSWRRIDAPVVDVTGRYAALIDRDPAVQTRRIAVLAVGIAFVIGFAAVAIAS